LHDQKARATPAGSISTEVQKLCEYVYLVVSGELVLVTVDDWICLNHRRQEAMAITF
jgi:hypothetical protein